MDAQLQLNATALHLKRRAACGARERESVCENGCESVAKSVRECVCECSKQERRKGWGGSGQK